MKVVFIGLGRMGHGMARRILDAGYELAVYDQVPAHMQALQDAGARAAGSTADAVQGADVVITMLPHDAALEELAHCDGGLVQSMSRGMIHMVMGTHGVEIIQSLAAAHRLAGQVLVATPVLGRPDLAAAGELTIVTAGPEAAIRRVRPLFEVLGRQTFFAGDEPRAATAVKVAHNFVLGCAIEVIGEAVALVRKLGVKPALLQEVLTAGLFGSPAYEIYGRIIVDQAYDQVGASAIIGLKDANLALAAAEVANMPLPSANVLRDRLLGAIAHGEGGLDWAVVARDQARASGLE